MIMTTVKFINFGMPEIFAVIYLKFKQRGQTLVYFIKKIDIRIIYNSPIFQCPNVQAYRNDPKFSDRYVWANSADPDQTALGLH